MTTPPPEMPEMPDPRRLLAQLQADVRGFEAQAERTNRAIAESSVEVAGEHLTLWMLGSHLTGIEFHEASLQLSPPRLTAALEAALQSGIRQSNRHGEAVAREVIGDASIARAVSELGPDEDDGTDPTGTDRTARGEDSGPAAPGTPADTPMTAAEREEMLDDLLNRMDVEDESLDLQTVMTEIGYVPSEVPPEQLQADFDAEIERIKASAAQLPQLMEQVEGTGTEGPCEVRVNAAGLILGARFRADFGREGAQALSERFAAAYASARQQAQTQLREQLGGKLGGSSFLDEL